MNTPAPTKTETEKQTYNITPENWDPHMICTKQQRTKNHNLIRAKDNLINFRDGLN